MIEAEALRKRILDKDNAESRAGIISVHPERLGGAPCFRGTRVPVKNLFDYLEGGDSLDDFLEGFPGVTREQAVAVLELAGQSLLENLRAV
jgi:uncharacterized protein (DUF433 family)